MDVATRNRIMAIPTLPVQYLKRSLKTFFNGLIILRVNLSARVNSFFPAISTIPT